MLEQINAIADYIGQWVNLTFALGSLFLAIALFWLYLHFFRFWIITIIRALGLYSPDHFRFYPRLPWRLIFKPFIGAERWLSVALLGRKQNARWAGPFEGLSRMYRPGMVFLGRLMTFNIPFFQPVGLKTQRHLMMVAGTGSGKTTSIISIASLWRGNCFVIDPKGQITMSLFNRMGNGGHDIIGKGGRVKVLDPGAVIDGLPGDRWNPFDELAELEDREGREAVPEMAAKMAEGLVQQDSNAQPIFANAAREFVKALILHVYTTEPKETRTLMKMRELMNQGVKDHTTQGDKPILTGIQRLLMLMDQNKSYTAIGNSIAAVRDALMRDNQGSFLSSANVQMGWIDFERIAAISDTGGDPEFSLYDLKHSDLSLFVVARTTDIQQTFTGWFRLLTVMAMASFERSSWAPKHSTLFVLDELPSIGRIDAVETAAPVMRSYGVQLLGITQDIQLLMKAYPDSWSSLLGNADAVWWMGTNNQQNLEYLENVIGGKTDKKTGRDRQLAYAEQLKRLLRPDSNRCVVTVNGERPLRLVVPHYFRELPVYNYDPDTNHAEAPLRQLGRWLMDGDREPCIEASERGPIFLRWLRWVLVLLALPAMLGVLLGGYVQGMAVAFSPYPWLDFIGLMFFSGIQAFMAISFSVRTAPMKNRLAKYLSMWFLFAVSIGPTLGLIAWLFTGFDLQPGGGGEWGFALADDRLDGLHPTIAGMAYWLPFPFMLLMFSSLSAKEIAED